MMKTKKPQTYKELIIQAEILFKTMSDMAFYEIPKDELLRYEYAYQGLKELLTNQRSVRA